MRVRVNYGPDAGTEKEFPYAVGLALVEAGRGVRVDPEDVAGSRVTTASPAAQHRDPAIVPSKVKRFGSGRR